MVCHKMQVHFAECAEMIVTPRDLEESINLAEGEMMALCCSRVKPKVLSALDRIHGWNGDAQSWHSGVQDLKALCLQECAVRCLIQISELNAHKPAWWQRAVGSVLCKLALCA